MPDALHFLVLTVAGWVNRPQDDQLAYLREEHRGLRASWPGGSVGPGTCRCSAASAPPRRRHVCHDHWPARAGGPGRNLRRIDRRCPAPAAWLGGVPRALTRSGRPGSLLTLAPHRSGRAGSAASGSSTDGFATRRRVPAGPGSQAMATAIPKACLASSAIRCRDVETGPNLGVLAVFPSTGATCRCPLPSTGSRGLNSPASAVL